MTIPLEGRLKWRETAPFHVQLELVKNQAMTVELGEIEVQGKVVRIFRTNGHLAVGDQIVFQIWVCHEGDEPTGPAYIYDNDFECMVYMEAYLYGNPPKCTLAAYEFSPISAPSEEPTLTVEDLTNLLLRPNKSEESITRAPKAKRWWKFWEM